MNRAALVLLSLVLVTPSSWAGEEECRQVVEGVRLKQAQRVAQFVRERLPQARDVKGYSILLAAMVGSAAATTFVTAQLPANLQFLSQFLAQASTLGVYVFGAPIWEPISSRFRKMAFGVHGAETSRGESYDPELIWRRTQENYSLNAQMSRNVITQFLTSVRQNFYEAHRAVEASDVEYAADQVASAAYLMRILFRDIPPDDASVKGAVRAAFTNHVQLDEDFSARVQAQLALLDEYYATPAAQAYYLTTLTNWLSAAVSKTTPGAGGEL